MIKIEHKEEYVDGKKVRDEYALSAYRIYNVFRTHTEEKDDWRLAGSLYLSANQLMELKDKLNNLPLPPSPNSGGEGK